MNYKNLNIFLGSVLGLLFDRNLGFQIIESSKWKKQCGIKGWIYFEYKQYLIQFIKDKYGLSINESECDALGIATWAKHNLLKLK
jgi:hypothetical protein